MPMGVNPATLLRALRTFSTIGITLSFTNTRAFLPMARALLPSEVATARALSMPMALPIFLATATAPLR